ncbi:MAG TPA: hypothetical protein VFE47_11005 [Tepidisphaeraceae bacterium]|jgi:hypothetical protein|nr:hypothetical protein [Tepidisphaeraceae bacterium]
MTGLINLDGLVRSLVMLGLPRAITDRPALGGPFLFDAGQSSPIAFERAVFDSHLCNPHPRFQHRQSGFYPKLPIFDEKWVIRQFIAIYIDIPLE